MVGAPQTELSSRGRGSACLYCSSNPSLLAWGTTPTLSYSSPARQTPYMLAAVSSQEITVHLQAACSPDHLQSSVSYHKGLVAMANLVNEFREALWLKLSGIMLEEGIDVIYEVHGASIPRSIWPISSRPFNTRPTEGQKNMPLVEHSMQY